MSRAKEITPTQRRLAAVLSAIDTAVSAATPAQALRIVQSLGHEPIEPYQIPQLFSDDQAAAFLERLAESGIVTVRPGPER